MTLPRNFSNEPRTAPADILRLCTTDPAEYEFALRPWELLCSPTSAGRFRHEIDAIRAEDFVVYRERYVLPFRLQGLTPPGMLALALPLSAAAGPTVWGQAWTDQALATSIGAPVEAEMGSVYGQVMALISIDTLRRAFPPATAEMLEQFAHHLMLDISAESADAFRQWMTTILDAATEQPVIASHPDYLELIRESLLDVVRQLIVDRLPGQSAAVTARQRAVSAVLHYLRSHKPERYDMAVLCEVAGVSERTLQYAFRDEFDLSPTEFVHRWRLHAVRRRLVLAPPRDVSVTGAALSCGFSELGRFAGEYQRLFGELPSATLRQHRAAGAVTPVAGRSTTGHSPRM